MMHEYVGTKIVTAWPQEKDGAEGYGVKYEDGYQSWSPKGAFEAAYVDCGHIAHLPPHQQRVIAEQCALDDKLENLTRFMASDIFRGLTTGEQARLMEQSTSMKLYSDILQDRIDHF